MSILTQLAIVVVVAVATEVVFCSTIDIAQPKETILKEISEHLQIKDVNEQMEIARDTASLDHEGDDFLKYTTGRLLCSQGAKILNNKDRKTSLFKKSNAELANGLLFPPPLINRLSASDRTKAVNKFVGKFNEGKAESEWIKVVPSGIYIDVSNGFLATNPDRLIKGAESDTIVIVVHKHTILKDHVDEDHFQAQIALHITGLQQCYLVNTHGEHEVITKDPTFREKNFPALKEFYDEHMLPIFVQFMILNNIEYKFWPGKAQK